MNKFLGNQKPFSVRNMAKVAILAAFASIIYLLEFNLPFFPAFYKLDLSEIVILIGGFAMGPWQAVVIELVKMTLNLIVNGTITAGVGEVSNFILGCSFVIPACLIYRRNKYKKSAVKGMIVGTVSLTVLGALLNYFALIPAYVALAGFPMDTIIGMANSVNPAVTSLETLVLFATIPFNLFKGVFCSLVTALLYKRISPILHI